MNGEEEEDNNIMLIKMLTKAKGPEVIQASINRKMSQLSTDNKEVKKDLSPQAANPLFT